MERYTVISARRRAMRGSRLVKDPFDIFRQHESPATKTFALTQRPPLFVSGAGSWLVDDQGNRYLDFACGSGTTLLGHNHPAVRLAVEQQLAAGLLHIGPHFHTASQQRLFHRLAEILPPHLDRYHPATNGSEATEVALKIAMHATGRRRFLVFEGGYHGRTLGALGVSAERGANARFGPLFPEIDVLPFPTLAQSDLAIPELRARAANTVRDAMLSFAGPYAGVIVEAVQATAGVRIAPPEALVAIAEVARERGWPLIVDEVFTAFGRTGHLLHSDALGMQADMVILAKCFGGGIPTALVAGRRSWIDRVPHGAQSSTFQLHPLAAATSLAMLDVFVGNALGDRAQAISHRFEARRETFMELAAVNAVRGIGALWGVEIAEAQSIAAPLTKSIRRAALDSGLITWECGLHGNVIGLVPPLTATDAELDLGVDRLLAAIRSTPR
jgi:4-aminobutyrate aminotransferase-like enzyme